LKLTIEAIYIKFQMKYKRNSWSEWNERSTI